MSRWRRSCQPCERTGKLGRYLHRGPRRRQTGALSLRCRCHPAVRTSCRSPSNESERTSSGTVRATSLVASICPSQIPAGSRSPSNGSLKCWGMSSSLLMAKRRQQMTRTKRLGSQRRQVTKWLGTAASMTAGILAPSRMQSPVWRIEAKTDSEEANYRANSQAKLNSSMACGVRSRLGMIPIFRNHRDQNIENPNKTTQV
jgi:hypothetical protein